MSISAFFLIGYGIIRSITEIFRQPDSHIGFDAFELVTRGQMLSVPMLIFGITMLIYSYKQPDKK